MFLIFILLEDPRPVAQRRLSDTGKLQNFAPECLDSLHSLSFFSFLFYHKVHKFKTPSAGHSKAAPEQKEALSIAHSMDRVGFFSLYVSVLFFGNIKNLLPEMCGRFIVILAKFCQFQVIQVNTVGFSFSCRRVANIWFTCEY